MRTLVRGLAERGSMMETWQEERVQSSRLERSGTVDMALYQTISASFEARRYRDVRSRLVTSYALSMIGSTELTLEELPIHVRAAMIKESVSAANSEEVIIRTENMSIEPDKDGDPMDFVDEEGYHHTHGVHYQLNGNGEMLECARTDAYDHEGETIVTRQYIEPYRRGKLVVGITDGVFVPESVSDLDIVRPKELKQRLAVDMALFEYANDIAGDSESLAQSRREHEARIFAIAAFITMSANPIESLQIALS